MVIPVTVRYELVATLQRNRYHEVRSSIKKLYLCSLFTHSDLYRALNFFLGGRDTHNQLCSELKISGCSTRSTKSFFNYLLGQSSQRRGAKPLVHVKHKRKILDILLWQNDNISYKKGIQNIRSNRDFFYFFVWIKIV